MKHSTFEGGTTFSILNYVLFFNFYLGNIGFIKPSCTLNLGGDDFNEIYIYYYLYYYSIIIMFSLYKKYYYKKKDSNAR